eukprot:3372628-Lingulodinium_polyedra.AAC.1
MAFPMTHVVEGFPCIAKYPIDECEEAGAPTMTTKGWAKLCLKVAEKDLKNLQNIFAVAKTLGGNDDEHE